MLEMEFERLKFPPPTRSSHLRCSSSTSMASKVDNIGVQHILGSASRNISSSRPDNLCICSSPSRQMIYLWLLFYPFFFEDNKKDTKEREKYVFANTIIGFPRNHGNFKAKIKIRLNNKLKLHYYHAHGNT